MRKVKKSSRGFIGSIGDDLPSLIPLFFALMIFFTALAFAFTTINEKNATINTYLDSLTIAKTALSDGSFASLSEFQNTGKNIVTMSNYLYGLVYIPKDNLSFDFESLLGENINDAFIQACKDGNIKFSDNTILTTEGVKNTNCDDDDDSYFLLSSSNVKEKLNQGGYDLLEDLKHRNYFYYLYPVTLLTPIGYNIVYLLVLVW